MDVSRSPFGIVGIVLSKEIDMKEVDVRSPGNSVSRLFAGLALIFAVAAGAQEIDWKKVDAALGKTAAVAGDVHRYGVPRSDLHVTVDGVTIRPTFALGGWVAFKPSHGGAMLMGDLVLLGTEITPVMSKPLGDGIDVTAIHNHVLRAALEKTAVAKAESPSTKY
jgi:hypothetical protein